MKPKSTLRHFLALAGSSLLAISSAHAVDGTWNVDAAGNWSVAGNWLTDPVDDIPGGAGSTVGLTNDITGNRTVTIDTDSRTVGNLTIGDASNTLNNFFTLAASDGAGLTFNNNGSPATLTSTNTIATVATARDTISAPITLADNLTVNVAGTYNSSGATGNGFFGITGGIDESGGARSITKEGDGALILDGNNTYSGGFTLNQGTVQVGLNAGTFDPFNGFGTGTLTINGGLIGTRSSASFTTANDSVWNGNFRLYRGQTGTATWNHGGDVTLGANVSVTQTNNFFNLNVSGDIGETDGPRSLTFAIATIILSGNNTYTGSTRLNAGTMNINSASAIGTGTLELGNTTGTGAVTINNTSGAAVTLGTNNAQTWNQNFTFTGAFDLDMGNGAVTMNNNRQVTVTANTLAVGGIGQSGGNRSLTKLGDGTLVIQGASSYTGGTTVTAGTLTVNGSLADASMSISSVATVNGSGSLTFNVDGTAADQVANAGTINVSGMTVAVNATGSGLTESEYVLVNGGTITGTFAGLTGAPGYALDYTTPGQVKLVGGSPSDPYVTWSGNQPFDGDLNNDGVDNGLAFLLGASGPNVSALDKLPAVTQTGGDLKLTFDMLPSAARGGAQLFVEHSSDLSTWATGVLVPDASGGTAPVTFIVSDSDLEDPAKPLDVEVTISSDAADGGKLFGRLKALNP